MLEAISNKTEVQTAKEKWTPKGMPESSGEISGKIGGKKDTHSGLNPFWASGWTAWRMGRGRDSILKLELFHLKWDKTESFFYYVWLRKIAGSCLHVLFSVLHSLSCSVSVWRNTGLPKLLLWSQASESVALLGRQGKEGFSIFFLESSLCSEFFTLFLGHLH